MFFQGGHRILVEAVTSEEAFGEHGKTTYHTKGKFNVEPFDVKDGDVYVLVMSSGGDKLLLHNYEKFNLRDVAQTNFNWSYSFTIDTPEDDFSIYAVLVDRFNDRYFERFQQEAQSMTSGEQFIGVLRREDRIDPMNFNLYWVRVN